MLLRCFQVVAEWQKLKLIPASLITVLWETLQGKRPELAKPAQRRAALALLNMAACTDSSLLRCKMDVLIQQLRSATADMILGQHACVALQRCAASSPMPHKAVRTLLHALDELLLRAPPKDQTSRWFTTAEQAVATIFTVSDSPEEVCTELLQRLSTDVFAGVDGADVCSDALARFIFLLGQVAIKTLVHIEVHRDHLPRRWLGLLS